MAPNTDCLKKDEVLWILAATKAFADIKIKMTISHVLRHPNFSKHFKITCDASNIGIGGILSKEGQYCLFQ